MNYPKQIQELDYDDSYGVFVDFEHWNSIKEFRDYCSENNIELPDTVRSAKAVPLTIDEWGLDIDEELIGFIGFHDPKDPKSIKICLNWDDFCEIYPGDDEIILEKEVDNVI
jgi:hypothetical protein